jgi:hypothetical protein
MDPLVVLPTALFHGALLCAWMTFVVLGAGLWWLERRSV